MYCDNCGLHESECTCWCECGMHPIECICGWDEEDFITVEHLNKKESSNEN